MDVGSIILNCARKKKWRIIKLKNCSNEVEPTLSTEWKGKQPDFIPGVTYLFIYLFFWLETSNVKLKGCVFFSMKGLVVPMCRCEIFVINSLSSSAVFTRVLAPAAARTRAHPCICGRVRARARFPLYSGMQPVSALLNPHSASKTPKPLIFFFFFFYSSLSPYPEENPFSLSPLSSLLSLSLSWDGRTRGNAGPAPHSDQI